MGISDLESLWELQKQQQKELGLAPEELSDVERRRLLSDLTLLCHEETNDLARLSGGHKRHILWQEKSQKADQYHAALECADVLKTLISIAQLHGLTAENLVNAFSIRTEDLRMKMRNERTWFTESCKVVCVDIDDTICDLEPWRDELKKNGPVDAAASIRLEASESMKTAFYEHGRFREMKAIPGAAAGLARLKSAGYKIVLITARPQWQHKRLHSDTVDWLTREAMPYDLLLFNRNKVEAIYDHVLPAWPLAFVEDHPQNAESISEIGIPVLLLDQPYNRHISANPGITRVASWTEITTKLGV